MRETLTKLVALQAIDDEARSFLQERNDLKNKLEALRALLDKGTQGLEEKKAKLADAKRWYDEKQSELAVDRAKVDKAKVKLQAVTKNKEYMAMQSEIESLRKGILAREEEIMKLLEAMEEFKAGISAEEKKLKVIKTEVAAEEKNNTARIKELDEHIAKIDARKVDVVKDIPRNMVSRYKRIFKARDGIVMSAIRNKSCGACNFATPAQQLNRILVGNTLEVCRNCSRQLYSAETLGVSEEPSEPASPA